MKTFENVRLFFKSGASLPALALFGAGIGATGWAAPAVAQDVTAGALSGTVVDEAGKPVAGAIVTMVSDRGATRTEKTNAAGTFEASRLAIGTYSVTVDASGYPATRTNGIAVALGGSAYRFTVRPGVVNDPVDMDADGTITVLGRKERTLDFSGTATGQVYDVQELASRVPIARTLGALQLLTPQVIPGGLDYGGFSMGGSAASENIIYVNGMNITDARSGLSSTNVPFEFYDQVQVKTGGYQAEFGRSTGGATIAVTRSGTNEMKGGMNLYWAPDALRQDAPNTTRNLNSEGKSTSIDGNMWASGPIIKDRLFFFAFFNPRSLSSSSASTKEIYDLVDDSLAGFEREETFTNRSSTPFYGGKIDLNLFDGHRLEATYFNDSTTTMEDSTSYGQFGRTLTRKSYRGGRNIIGKYIGVFSDWLTLSATYGSSKYSRNSTSDADLVPWAVDYREQGFAALSGSGFLGTAADERTNYRADADLSFTLLGDHHVRFGGDVEKISASAFNQYSGGISYGYFRTGPGETINNVPAPTGTDYVVVGIDTSGGVFKSENRALYVQDSWDVTPRLNLSIGLRYDRFENMNASSETFVLLDKQFAPRLGFSYDVFGDRSTKLTAFYGKFYLPISGTTNIRLAGNAYEYEEYFELIAPNQFFNPTLGKQIGPRDVRRDRSNVQASGLMSQNVKPQSMDELLIGLEHRFGERFRVSVNGVYRKLTNALEDIDTRYVATAFCRTQNLPGCNAVNAPTGSIGTSGQFGTVVAPSINGATIGSGGRVLFNPGSDVIIPAALTNDGTLTTITIPAGLIGMPKAVRDYKAMEFKIDREYDGVWSLGASYVLASAVGNYEGNLRTDMRYGGGTGTSNAFDTPGAMDGAYGYLPNHRRHQLKMYGSVSPLKNVDIGFNGLLISPRKLSCVGSYPFNDGRYRMNDASTYWCSNPIATGLPLVVTDPPQQPTARIPGYTAPVLIGRGRFGETDWNKQIDISVGYTVPLRGLRTLKLRADMFNAFNFKSKTDFDEGGDLYQARVSSGLLGRVTGYQEARNVRLGASLTF